MAGKRQMADWKLLHVIHEVHRKRRARYCARRICAELQAQGLTCSRKPVARLMTEHSFEAKRRHRYRITTQRTP